MHQNQLTLDITSTQSQPPNSDKQAWLLLWGWGLLLSLALLARGGRLLIPIFPLGSVAIGLFLYFRTPALYVGYTWWVCFLGELVRRIIDYQSGYVTPGRWGVSSMLVAAISLITVFEYLPKAYRLGGLPLILSTASVIYAFLVGLVFGKHDLQYMVGFIEWLAPVAFSFHLFINWRNYPTYRQVIQRCFVWGTLIMGAYAIFQYCVAPEWDRFYMDQINAPSFGKPFPFEIRAFGTQGSPQGFATVMMAGLLLLFGAQEQVRFLSSGVGYLAFLLSMARTGWLGWIVGTVAFFPFLKPRFQMQFALTLVLMAGLVVPLAMTEPFSEVIQQRFESLTNPEQDVSYQERSAGYSDALGLALTEVTGRGIGNSGPSTSLGGSDSGILPLLFSFGWIGAVPYAGGALWMLLQITQTKDKGQDTFSSAARAIVLGTFAQVGFNNIFPSALGLVLWGFLGISLAAHKYYSRLESSGQTSL